MLFSDCFQVRERHFFIKTQTSIFVWTFPKTYRRCRAVSTGNFQITSTFLGEITYHFHHKLQCHVEITAVEKTMEGFSEWTKHKVGICFGANLLPNDLHFTFCSNRRLTTIPISLPRHRHKMWIFKLSTNCYV